MAQFISQEAIDQLVDGAAGVAELLPRVSATCAAEDASLGLVLEGVDELIADVWAGAEVPGGRSVTATPRLDELHRLGRENVTDAAQREIVNEAHAGITGNLAEACQLIGYGLYYIANQYEDGDCLRELLQRSPAPGRGEIEAMLDRFEALAERRQTLLGLRSAAPWLVGGAVVLGLGWLILRKKKR